MKTIHNPKHITLIISIISIISTSLIACDKIEPGENGEYTIFAGTTATWTDGMPIASPVHRALVEKYTGPQCVNCPTADRILNEAHDRIGDQMVILAITPGGGDGRPYSGQPDMSTEDGDKWCETFGGGVNMTLPFAMVDRNVSYQGASTMNGVESAVNSTIEQQPVAAVEAEATTATSGKVAITVNVNYLQDCDSAMTLTLALSEDSLAYYQAATPSEGGFQTAYKHNHMLRDVITDVWGFDIQAEGRAGEARKARFEYTLPDGVVKENCHIIAFVSYKKSRRVINCAQCEIDD